MGGRSLSQRLFFSAAIVIALFLGLSSLILDQAFSTSLENIVREKLRVHTYAIIAAAEIEDRHLYLPARLAEARFNQADEALIAIVTRSDGDESWRSISAQNHRFSLPFPEEGKWLFGRAEDHSGNQYFVSSYSTLWPNEQGGQSAFIVTVMEDLEYYERDLQNYRSTITLALTLIGAILLALQAIIFRWGLAPVRTLAAEVDKLGQGEGKSLGGAYPKELQGLVGNLNLLIDNERRQREKYRDRMADLSHSLKTPLSVLKGLESELADIESKEDSQQALRSLKQQVAKMHGIIDYQLRQAVSSGQNISFVAIDLAPELGRTLDALDKVYAQKNVVAELDIEDELQVYADEGDLAELLGNLLDNAYKHCHQKVMASASSAHLASGEACVEICIEDDGPGVPLDKRDTILRRGVRLDSTQPGQGFGLAIVAEIVSTYGGSITIAPSSMGGALFILRLPTR